MGELSEGTPTIEAVSKALASLKIGANKMFAEIGRFAHAVAELGRATRIRREALVPPHPFLVGSYDLECRYPNCGLGPEEHRTETHTP